MISDKQIKLAKFVAYWTERRLSDVVRAIEDGRSMEVSAWATEAEGLKTEADRVATKQKAREDALRAQHGAQYHQFRELKNKMDERLRPLRKKNGPMYRQRSGEKGAWLAARGWSVQATHVSKDGIVCGPSEGVNREIISEIEREEGRPRGEYQKVWDWASEQGYVFLN